MGRDYSNDYELLYAIYQMDEACLQELFDKYHIVIKNTLQSYFIRSILSIYGEELIQEAIVLLYDAIYGYREDCQASFATYYRNILHNKLTNFYRALNTHDARCVRDSLSLDYCIGKYERAAIESLPNENINFEGVNFLYQFEIACLIRKFANQLTSDEKEIFLLRIRGFSYTEIAKTLHINRKKVDNTLHKIRKQKV